MNTLRSSCFVLCTLWHGLAFAQSRPVDDATRSQASARFQRGVELFQEEAYRAALVEFERAYEIAPDYRLLYNIAQTRLQVQDYLGAAQSYEAYLTEGASQLPEERRAQVEEALKALRERVGRIRVRVNRDDVDVLIDDQRVGRAPLTRALLANVGRRRITARSDEGDSDTQLIDLAGGDLVEVQLRLVRPAQATPPADVPREASRLSSRQKAAVTSWAGGGALLIGGLVTSLLTMRSGDQLDKLLDTREVARDAVDRQRANTRALALSSDVLFGAGAALVLAGSLLWLLDSPEQRTQAAKLSVGAGSLTVHGRF